MDEQKILQDGVNPDDSSMLLSRMSRIIGSKKRKIAIGTVALVLILIGVYVSLKPPNQPTSTDTEAPVESRVVVVTSPADGTPAFLPEIVTDKDGKEYLTGEIIVAFRASVPVEEAKKMVIANEGTIKQHLTQSPVFLVGISEKGAEGVNRAILRFQTITEVERVEPNYLTGGVTP